MPNYEYQCPKCGTFELFQSIKDEALKKCPTCGSKKVERLISGGTGFVLKGSGFYQNDYKNPSRTAGEAKDKEGSKAPEKKENAAPPCCSCKDAPSCPSAKET